VVAGFSAALALGLSATLIFAVSGPAGAGVASIWFLAMFPATLSALVVYVGDPDRDRPASFYWLTPVVLVAVVDFGAAFFLHEGVICLIMLSPAWILSGWGGAFAARRPRKSQVDPNVFSSSFLIAPFILAILETALPPANDPVTLSRNIEIFATPAEVWRFAVANPHISPHEGKWTISQNIVGLPRPRATVLHGQGVGAVRNAYWGEHIHFDEIITAWRPGRELAWTFSFPDASMQDFTDKHLSPDGRYLKVDSGAYTITPLSPVVTRLTLTTHYIAKTHVNPYAELWGELFLGDVQDNILAIIKSRAETQHDRMAAQGRGRPFRTAA
jgi:hypothetical protein